MTPSNLSLIPAAILLLTACSNKPKANMQDNTPFEINAPIEHKELNGDGYSIHYFASGDSSKELIVFLHPAFADHRCFDSQIDFFSGHYRIVTIDLPGHGLSQPGKQAQRIEQSAQHIQRIMANEGYDKAHLVGVSMGSLIAQDFAIQYPQCVHSLTVMGGYSITSDTKELNKAQRSENLKWMVRIIFSMDSFRRYVSRVSVKHPHEQARFYAMAQAFTRRSLRVMSGLSKLSRVGEDLVHQNPLLILCGEHDIEIARRINLQWHKDEPQSRFALIGNAGHCANMDNAEEFNGVLLGFLRGE